MNHAWSSGQQTLTVMKRESWGSICKALLEGVVMKQALVGKKQTVIDEARQRVILGQA